MNREHEWEKREEWERDGHTSIRIFNWTCIRCGRKVVAAQSRSRKKSPNLVGSTYDKEDCDYELVKTVQTE